MKRFLSPLLFSLLFGVFFPLAALAGGVKTIAILYTGSVKGMIDPCAA